MLQERGTATLLRVTVRYAWKAARDVALATNFVTGMELCYNALAEVLAGEGGDA